jgi:ribonuclease HII
MPPRQCRSFADSKTLTEAKREALYEEIVKDLSMGFAVDALSAKELSAKMLSRHTLFPSC